MRGGKRNNSGRKHKWFMGETVTVRIPLIFKDDVIALIKEWDDRSKKQSEKLAKEISSDGYFVWWLTQQDCESMTLVQQQGLPEYIALELSSRRGRAGRGRLWVAPNMGLPEETNNIPMAINDIGGIVIRGVDKKYLPVGIGMVIKA